MTKDLLDQVQHKQIYTSLCHNITFSGGRTLFRTDPHDRNFFEIFAEELNSVFGTVPILLINPCPRDDVILGGCCLGMLGKFKQLVLGDTAINEPENLFSSSSKSHHNSLLDFYNIVICTSFYWFRDFDKLS